MHITNVQFSEGKIEFDSTGLTKIKTKELVKNQLILFGKQGCFEAGHFDYPFEEGERYNKIYDEALKFMKNKYDVS
jgi:hypothetical protein